MMDHLARPPLAESHVEGVENQRGSQMVGHRPPAARISRAIRWRTLEEKYLRDIQGGD